MTKHDKSDTPDDGPPPADAQTWAQKVTKVMTMTGFSPKPALGPSTIEYRKLYSDPEGRQACVTALISKGLEGLEPARLEAFVLTVQVRIPATTESIESAPVYIRGDLRQLVATLSDDGDPVRRDTIALDCAMCGKRTSEYVIDRIKNRPLCQACYKIDGPRKLDA